MSNNFFRPILLPPRSGTFPSFRSFPSSVLCSAWTPSFCRPQNWRSDWHPNRTAWAPLFSPRLHLPGTSPLLCGFGESASGLEADWKARAEGNAPGKSEGERGPPAVEVARTRSGEENGPGRIGGAGAEERRSERAAETFWSSKMGEMLNLEKQFSFYGSYHSNHTNILIHIFFVWPIFYTSLILWAYTPALAPLPLPGGTLPFQQYMVLNVSFIQAAFYALYYVALDRKAGSLGAAICLGCWIGANAVAQALPWSLSWKIVLASQLTCWFAQIYGHKKYERRSPALLDNLPQAFLMAPFFVLLEGLQTVGYEPYPGFRKQVETNVDNNIREFRANEKEKKAA